MPARPLAAAVLAGFGAWHVVDAVASHWLLGIHRVRMDTDSPLLWDLLWVGVFGIVPLLMAVWMARPGRPGDTSGVPGGATVALIAAVMAGAGGQALRSPTDTGFTTVLFMPGTESGTIFAAVASVDARIAWVDASGRLIVLAHRPGERPLLSLLSHGAVAFSSTMLAGGCFSALR